MNVGALDWGEYILIHDIVYKPERAPDQDLRCIGRYGLLFACADGSAIVGEDGTVRVVDYPARQAWVLPECPSP